MMIVTCYLDASALVKLAVAEPGSEKVKEYMGRSALVCTTMICFAEALGVFKRMYDHKLILHGEYLTYCAILMGQVRDQYIEIDNKIKPWDFKIFSEVETIAKAYCLDVSDSFQVVALKKGSLAPFKGTPAEAVVITADRKLSKVLVKEGCKAIFCLD